MSRPFKTVFNPSPVPKNSPLEPQKLKNDPKIGHQRSAKCPFGAWYDFKWSFLGSFKPNSAQTCWGHPKGCKNASQEGWKFASYTWFGQILCFGGRFERFWRAEFWEKLNIYRGNFLFSQSESVTFCWISNRKKPFKTSFFFQFLATLWGWNDLKMSFLDLQCVKRKELTPCLPLYSRKLVNHRRPNVVGKSGLAASLTSTICCWRHVAA